MSERTDSPDPRAGSDARAGAAEGGRLSDLGARGLAGALRPLAGLGNLAEDIREMTAYVARMARNTDTLPEVTATLRAIRERTEHMDKEVTEMHAAVEDLRDMLGPVAGQLESVVRVTDRLPGGRKARKAREAAAREAAEAEGDVSPQE